MNTSAVYLDYMASTPVDPEVASAMADLLKQPLAAANPSSAHTLGRAARQVIEQARDHLRQALGDCQHQLIWTSGATEAINLALQGATQQYRHVLKKILVLATDHPAVLRCAQRLRLPMEAVALLPSGHIDLDDLQHKLQSGRCLLNLSVVNSEMGTIQPIDEVLEQVHRYGALCHVDAAQALGKIPMGQWLNRADFVSLSSHKFHGPKGVGCLLLRPDRMLEPLLWGGGQESKLRAGTEGLHNIHGMALAAIKAIEQFDHRLQHVRRIRHQLVKALESVGCTINNQAPYVPHNIHCTLPALSETAWQTWQASFLVSQGSACQVEAGFSHVLQSLGWDEAKAKHSYRLSLSHWITEDQLAHVVSTLPVIFAS